MPMVGHIKSGHVISAFLSPVLARFRDTAYEKLCCLIVLFVKILSAISIRKARKKPMAI